MNGNRDTPRLYMSGKPDIPPGQADLMMTSAAQTGNSISEHCSLFCFVWYSVQSV
jgi:hypothetical protein